MACLVLFLAWVRGRGGAGTLLFGYFFGLGGDATHAGLCCRILDFFVVVGLYYSAAEMLQDSGPWQVTPRLTPVGTDNDYHLQFLDFVKNFTIFTCEKFHNEKFSFCK